MSEIKTYKIGSLENGFPGMEDSKGRGEHPFAFTNLENVEFTPLGGLSIPKSAARVVNRGGGSYINDLRRLQDGRFLAFSTSAFEAWSAGGALSFSIARGGSGSLNLIESKNIGVFANGFGGLYEKIFVGSDPPVNTSNYPSGGFAFSVTALVLVPATGATIPAGTYQVTLTEAVKITDVAGDYYVRVSESIFSNRPLLLIALGDSIQITSTWGGPVFAVMARVGTDEVYDLGVFTAPLTISKLPLATGVSNFGHRSARVTGSIAVSAHGRTWVVGQTIRSTQDDSVPNPVELPSSAVLYSRLNEPWSFPPENYFVLDALDGPTTAVESLGNGLVVFTANNAVFIAGNSSADFNVQRLGSVSPGTLRKQMVCEHGGVVYYLAADGVYALQSSGQVTEISLPIREYYLGKFNSSSNSVIGVDRTARKLRVSLNDVQFNFDLRAGRWSTDPGAAGCSAISSDGQTAFYAVRPSNDIYQWGVDTTATVDSVLEMEFLDLGEAEVDKRPLRFRVATDNPAGVASTAQLFYADAQGNAFTGLTVKTIGTGRGILNWSLPVQKMTGRGFKLQLRISSKPGVQLLAPISVDFRERRRVAR